MKKIVVFSAILVLIIGVPVAQKFIGNGNSKLVKVAPLAPHAIKASILASGNLNHEEKVQLSTELIGKVKEIYVREGDTVKKSQLLLQIDDEAYISALEQNQAAVRLQKIEIDRLKSNYDNINAQGNRKKILYEKKLIDQQTYENASLDVSVAELQVRSGREKLIQAEAQLAQAKNNLAKTRAYSPIDGVVTALNIKVGETAIAGTMNFAASSLMTIANPNSLRAEVFVDEADIFQVTLGKTAKVVAIAHPEEPINGAVDFIAETAKVANGRSGLSFSVKIRLDNDPNIKLWPGMSARAEIFTSEDSINLAAPIQAIIEQPEANDKNTRSEKGVHKGVSDKNNSHAIFILREGKAKRIAVNVGLSDDEFQSITPIISNTLKHGDQVITGPDKILRHLNDGDNITVESDSSST